MSAAPVDPPEETSRFIVIEGPIGVGKTSLARRLAESLGGDLVLEQADQNPFLERFYRDPQGAALPTQLHFLFQRAQQLAARQIRRGVPVGHRPLFRPFFRARLRTSPSSLPTCCR